MQCCTKRINLFGCVIVEFESNELMNWTTTKISFKAFCRYTYNLSKTTLYWEEFKKKPNYSTENEFSFIFSDSNWMKTIFMYLMNWFSLTGFVWTEKANIVHGEFVNFWTRVQISWKQTIPWKLEHFNGVLPTRWLHQDQPTL